MGDSDASDIERQAVVRAIIAYLRDHPGASDTSRGVREWWLDRLRPPPSQAMVDAALWDLSRRGLVRATTNLDRSILWSARPEPAGDP